MGKIARELYWPACPEPPQHRLCCAGCRQWVVGTLSTLELVSIERYQLDNSGEAVVVYWVRCERCVAREALDALA